MRSGNARTRVCRSKRSFVHQSSGSTSGVVP
jgi:hypothetical protein